MKKKLYNNSIPPGEYLMVEYKKRQRCNTGCCTSAYVLPIASSTVLGGIKVGEGLHIDSKTGVLSTNPFVETDPTVPSWVKAISLSDITLWNSTGISSDSGNDLTLGTDGKIYYTSAPSGVSSDPGNDLTLGTDGKPFYDDPSVNLSIGVNTNEYIQIFNDYGTGFTLNEASSTLAGLMSANDKTKLDSLSNYILPPATTSTLGGVIVGDGLTVGTDGTIDVIPYNLFLVSGHILYMSGPPGVFSAVYLDNLPYPLQKVSELGNTTNKTLIHVNTPVAIKRNLEHNFFTFERPIEVSLHDSIGFGRPYIKFPVTAGSGSLNYVRVRGHITYTPGSGYTSSTTYFDINIAGPLSTGFAAIYLSNRLNDARMLPIRYIYTTGDLRLVFGKGDFSLTAGVKLVIDQVVSRGSNTSISGMFLSNTSSPWGSGFMTEADITSGGYTVVEYPLTNYMYTATEDWVKTKIYNDSYDNTITASVVSSSSPYTILSQSSNVRGGVIKLINSGATTDADYIKISLTSAKPIVISQPSLTIQSSMGSTLTELDAPPIGQQIHFITATPFTSTSASPTGFTYLEFYVRPGYNIAEPDTIHQIQWTSAIYL